MFLGEAKELLKLVENLPGMVMWVLAGILLYKVIIIGSIFSVIRLGITKVYDAWAMRLTLPEKLKPPEIEYHSIKDRHFIGVDDSYPAFIDLLKTLTKQKGYRQLYYGDYIHAAHIDFCREAVLEKLDREKPSVEELAKWTEQRNKASQQQFPGMRNSVEMQNALSAAQQAGFKR